jgi:opacity protein-like surface antigen
LTATHSGWLAGVWLEWASAPNWTMKIEYDYLALENYSATSPFAPGDALNLSNNTILKVALGINYMSN